MVYLFKVRRRLTVDVDAGLRVARLRGLAPDAGAGPLLGTTKYDVQLPAFDENGGLQRIRHDEPTMFLARNHPASMRFVKKFWDWVRDARDYVRSRLG